MPTSPPPLARYGPLPVPGAGEDPTPDTLRREIDAWISSVPFTDLLAAEGATPTGDLAERLAYLDGFSAGAWDFRGQAARAAGGGSVERNQVDQEAVTGPREQQVLDTAAALGLVGAQPPRFDEYDHVLVLGGLVRANVVRSAYAAVLLEAGTVKAPQVTALTAYRPLAANAEVPAQDEPTLLRGFDLPEREDEAGVMQDAMERAFGVSTWSTEREAEDFRVASGQARPWAGQTTLVVAPNPKERRATTASTMQFWAREIAGLKPGQRILFVTTAIYVPFQHAVALQHLGLPFGVAVDTVAVDHTLVDPGPHAQIFRGVNYLQELRSAVRAYRTLLGMLT
jgi:hypothetical protein